MDSLYVGNLPYNSTEDEVAEYFNELGQVSKGTGLGLYIVKQVLSNHNGYITVRNNTPKGSIFEVIFEKNVE